MIVRDRLGGERWRKREEEEERKQRREAFDGNKKYSMILCTSLSHSLLMSLMRRNQNLPGFLHLYVSYIIYCQQNDLSKTCCPWSQSLMGACAGPKSSTLFIDVFKNIEYGNKAFLKSTFIL